MYALAINTNKYNISLLASRFGRKTRKTIQKTIKSTDIVKLMKKFKKSFSHCDMEKLQLPV